MIRDNVREQRPYIFDKTDIKNWKATLEEFQRLGLIDANQLLTNAGQDFFDSDPFARE